MRLLGIQLPGRSRPRSSDSGSAIWQRLILPRLGIAGRLAIAFVSVAALIIAANIIIAMKVSMVHTTEIRREIRPAAAPAPKPVLAPEPAGPVEIVPLPQKPTPAPSTDLLTQALDSLDRAVLSRVDLDSAETNQRYQDSVSALDNAFRDLVKVSAVGGEAPPARLSVGIRGYEQHAAELVHLADSRRSVLTDYATHFERLNGRVKQSLDRAWKIFGRVVARQSLVRLTGNLDELRRQYAQFIATQKLDPSALAALATSEEAIQKTLNDDRAGFTKADGEEWFTQSLDDLTTMASARTQLMQTDEQQRATSQLLTQDFGTITQDVTRWHNARKAEQASRMAAFQRAKAAAVAAASVSSRAKPSGANVSIAPGAPSINPASSALTGASASNLTSGSTDPATEVPANDRDGSVESIQAQGEPDSEVEPQVSTTVSSERDGVPRALIAWISAGVLLLLVFISVGTVLSIVRPVRRLLTASAALAKGDATARVRRGGIRELDTLALAFNEMAGQLGAAQQAARSQQQVLEAKVIERTRQLQELAQVDPLTRLANRRQLFSLLNSAINSAARENRRVGVFFLDIDNFKNMNDSLGHAFGDHVLQAIAERLAECSRPFGFAARLGGDEFTVIYMSAATSEEIHQAGLQLVDAFRQPLLLDGREPIVSVSVGASIFPDHEANAESLLRAADAALFHAKALGRSRLALFTPQLLETATVKFSTEQGLRRAIERGEFELLFQPEINLETCQTEVVEALVRWRLPDGRYALPGEFMHIAEESGLINQISDWVLRSAVQTASRWHHGPWPDVRIAVNISPRQLFDQGFVARMKALLEEFALPPRCIEIELTETVLQTGSSTIEAVRELADFGLSIALDDFGTGFSSFSSLEQLPLTRIKLDRSLVASLDTNPRSAAIASAIIGLCENLGLAITAEGIERPEQLRPLLGRKSIYAQGYLLAHPLRIEDLLPIVAQLPVLAREILVSALTGAPQPEAVLAVVPPEYEILASEVG